MDHLPNHRDIDRNNGQPYKETDCEHQPVLFGIGQRDQGDHKRREDVLKGIGVSNSRALSIMTVKPTTRLVVPGGVGQRG